MGVNICLCNHKTDNVIKESSIDCFKKNDPSYFVNVITANSNNINQNIDPLNENIDEKKKRKKYKKLFKENRRISNSNLAEIVNNKDDTLNHELVDETYISKINKIQKYFREHLKIKNEKKEMEKLEKNRRCKFENKS